MLTISSLKDAVKAGKCGLATPTGTAIGLHKLSGSVATLTGRSVTAY